MTQPSALRSSEVRSLPARLEAFQVPRLVGLDELYAHHAFVEVSCLSSPDHSQALRILFAGELYGNLTSHM